MYMNASGTQLKMYTLSLQEREAWVQALSYAASSFQDLGRFHDDQT